MDETKTLRKAIRKKCLECSGGSTTEVEACAMADCPLFQYRLEQGSLIQQGTVLVGEKTVAKTKKGEIQVQLSLI